MLLLPVLEATKKNAHILICKIQKKVYLLMFTGEVGVKLLRCIADNGL